MTPGVHAALPDKVYLGRNLKTRDGQLYRCYPGICDRLQPVRDPRLLFLSHLFSLVVVLYILPAANRNPSHVPPLPPATAMLPPSRKNSKSTTPKPVSSQQTSSSFSGGWLPNLDTNNPHTSLADMPVIEFPQPETSSQPQTSPPTLPPQSSDSPPPSAGTTTQPPSWTFMPVVSDLQMLEPAASPMQHLSPQQTSDSFSGGWLPNLDTNKLHTSLADVPVVELSQSGTSSQPQTLPPTLPPQSPAPPPASPMPPLAPGDGVGGFTLIPPLYRESIRDDLLRGTIDHTHLFGPESSPHPDSRLPNFKTIGTSEGMHAGVCLPITTFLRSLMKRGRRGGTTI